ncbi:MAG: MFS transporter [Burkholderiales bacterium]|nr:MFS transporter [Burkholderiales bacterium]
MTVAAQSRKTALLLVSSLTVMSNATIAASMPQMARVFSDTPNAEFLTKLVLTTPALLIVVCAPFAGAIIDRFGRVRFLYACMVLYGLAGASGFVLSDLYHILAGRALLGVAVAGVMTTAQTLTGDYFSGEERLRFSAVQSIFMSIGGVVFIGLGGVLADLDWRLPFLIYLASWLFLVPAVLFLDEPLRQARQAADAPGEPVPYGGLALAYALCFFMLVMFYMTPVQIPFLLREIGVPSGALAAGAIAMSSLTSAGGGLLLPRLRRRMGFVTIYGLSMLGIAAGYFIVAWGSGYGTVLAGVAISGFAVGVIFPNSSLWIITLAPARLRGRLLGLMTASVFLGQFASPILVQPAVSAVGITGAFAVFAAIAIAVAVALLAARKRLDAQAARRPAAASRP